MKRKTILFLCTSALIFTLTANPAHPISANADTTEVEYLNNAYQVHKYQDNISNYFLYDSIYSTSNRFCLLKNSIRLKKPKSNILTLYLEFTKEISSLQEGGRISYYILSDDGDVLKSLDLQIYDERDIEMYEGDFSFYYNENILMIQMNCTSLPEYFVIAGNEYLGQDKAFCIDLSSEALEDNYIRKYKLIDVPISRCQYSVPELGKYSGYESPYYSGDQFYWEINYDNRLSIDQIVSNIVAYDYGDNKELEKEITNDTYTQAVKDNVLGTYKVNVSATDSQNHKSIITLNLEIKDLTGPTIIGDDTLTISYTALGENRSLDLQNYYYGQDNYDGRVSINSGIYSFGAIKDYDLYVSSKDSSNNIGSKLIKVKIIDDVDPTIEGPDELDLYQFEIGSPAKILDKYTFSDGEGSGIKNTGFLDNFASDDLIRVGSVTHTIFCEDNFGNMAQKQITINIKDGIGPVFFINAKELSVTTSSLLTSDDIQELLSSKGNIKNVNYTSTSFMDNEYVDNYNKVGSYETKLVCYKEDGSRDFYKVKINVEKAKEKNVFKSFLQSILNIFSKIGRFFKYIWNLFLLGN